jgi:hypothetical protein
MKAGRMNSRQGKRPRQATTAREDEEEVDQDLLLELGQHPYGVLPLGNAFLVRDAHLIRARSLGSLALLHDSIVQAILSELDAADLSRLSRVSRVFYVFCYDDDIWKSICFDEFPSPMPRFERTWRDSYVRWKMQEGWGGHSSPIATPGLCSDVLYHTWLGAAAHIEQWALSRETVDRIHVRDLTVQQFRERYEFPRRPVVITGGASAAWAGGPASWTPELLAETHGRVVFGTQQGPELSLENYIHYQRSVRREDNPLYLFDPMFGEKAPSLANYKIPHFFPDDYFADLPAELRPSYRWLLMGGKRSGSPFHKDPNMTSAWNGLICGRKKWLFYAPDTLPPGVLVDGDPDSPLTAVSTPVSVLEWFRHYYRSGRTGQLECMQQPGDLVYIPHGWWHSVLNLAEGLALTQNYVSEHNAARVLGFLRQKRKLALARAFEEILARRAPHILAAAELPADKKQTVSPSLWSRLRPADSAGADQPTFSLLKCLGSS